LVSVRKGEGEKGEEPVTHAGRLARKLGTRRRAASKFSAGKPIKTAAYHGKEDRLGTTRANRRRTPTRPPVLAAMRMPAMDGPKAAR